MSRQLPTRTGRGKSHGHHREGTFVSRGGETVGGTSIMGLMMLGASTGTTITVEATGKEATAAIEAIDKLVSGGFGEED